MALPVIIHPQQDEARLRQQKISLCAMLDVSRKNKDNTYTVRIRVIENRFPKLYSTRIQLTEMEYLQIVSGKPREELRSKKILIYELLKKANDLILEMDDFSFTKFDRAFLGKQGDWKNVYLAFEDHIKALEEKGQIGTASTYRTAYNSFKTFRKGNILEFKDVDVDFLESYERWLKNNNYSVTTVSINTRCLRRLYNLAIIRGDAKREYYPFGNSDTRKFQPPEARNVKKALTVEDLKKFFEYSPKKGSREEYYRDLFLFSYLGNGMNMSDIAYLKFENIQGNEIVFIRKKTSTKRVVKPIQVNICEEIRKIISKYGNDPRNKDNYIFNILENGLDQKQQKQRIHQTVKMCNRHIRRIAKIIGINEDISTYYARHTFASMLNFSGESISFIQESMGHSNIKTTENYLASFGNEKRAEAQKKLKPWQQ